MANTRTLYGALICLFLSGCAKQIKAQPVVTPYVKIIASQDGTASWIDVETNSTTAGFPLAPIRIYGSLGKEFYTADSYGISAYPGYYANKAGGTATVPTATPAGSHLGGFFGGGHTGSAPSGAKGWFAVDSPAGGGTWSPTSTPTELSFATTPVGSTTITRRWFIGSDGVLTPVINNFYGIGTTSLRVGTFAGSIGDFSGNVSVGGALLVSGLTTLTGTTTLGSGSHLYGSATSDLGQAGTPFVNAYIKYVDASTGYVNSALGLFQALDLTNTHTFTDQGASVPSAPGSAGQYKLYYGQTSGGGRGWRYERSSGVLEALLGSTNLAVTSTVTASISNGIFSFSTIGVTGSGVCANYLNGLCTTF